MKYEFDYSKLAGRITEVAGTKIHMAELMGMSKMTMTYRMQNKLPFTQPEIMDMCKILGITKSQIPLYFFTIKVSQ